MMDRQTALRPRAVAFAVALAWGLSACGGGGGGGSNVRPTPPPPVDPGSGGTKDPDVTYDSSSNATWSKDLGGTGGLVKDGSGTLILTGTNTYTGGTSIHQGTLQIGSGGSTGSIVGDVKDDGALVFDRSDQLVFGGAISGHGSLEQAGEGRLVLTGTNTYTGGTSINYGTLQIGNGGKTGSIVGDVTDKGSLVFNRADDVIFAGVIDGSGSLEQAGKGRLILTGDSSYTGGTTISQGTLQVGNGGVTGSIAGDVSDNGSLVFDRDDDVTFAGVISGNGSVEQAGKGRLILTADNTYTGGTTISHGTLQLGDGGTTGWITGGVRDDGILVFDRGDDVTFEGAISGKGALVQSGNGTLVLTGTNTYTAGTTISSGGTIQIGSGGSNGSIIGDVIDNGSLVFDRSSDPVLSGVVSGVISGDGSVTQAGTDTLILAGANTYTGGTTIASGTLQVGNYGATGSIAGDVADNGSLVFARSGDLTFNGVVSGTGSLTKTGEGTLVVAGASTYTGGTTVAGGTLEIASGGALGTGDIAVGGSGVYYFDDHILKVDNGVTLSNHILLGGFGTLDNAGRLEGAREAVAGYSTVSTVLNHDGGIIDGENVAIAFAQGGEVRNDGGGSVLRSSGGTAIQIMGDQGIVENTGGATIAGGSTAIYLEHGGEVTNGQGSTIQSTGTSAGDCGAATACAIFVASAEMAPTGATGELDLANAGTIVGDVRMIATALNRATLTAGGSIQGDLAMGSNQQSTLTLNGEGGTLQRYSDAVTGTTTFAGLFIKNGGGVWIIDTNDLDHAVDARVESGTLQIGDGGTSGQVGSATSGYHAPISIQVYSSATLSFNRSDDVLYWGWLNGLGGANLVQMGTGDLSFPDLRVIEGFNLLVERGSVTLGDGSFQNAYLRPTSITNNGTLAFDNDGQVYLEGGISGNGSLVKQGPGMLSLDGVNTYTGNTTVAEGTLRAMGVLPGDVTVGPGTVLQGAAYTGIPPGLPGTVGDLSSAGRIEVRDRAAHVGGSYTQASTGTLAVSLGSKLDVAGTATLNGGTLEITGADNGYVSNTHTDVLTATGGVAGTFDRLVKDTGVVFTSTTINYDGNSVWLDTTGLDVTTAAAGAGVSYTPVSMASAVRVQSTFAQLDDQIASGDLSNVSDDFLRSAGEFQQAPTLLDAQASLQSLSGELHAVSAAMTFDAIDASDRVLSDRFDSLLDKGTGSGMWTHELSMGGGMARAGYDGVRFQLDGWLVGSDRMIGHSGVAGFAFGQSRGQQRLDGNFDRDNSRTTEAMLYAGWLEGSGYLQGRVGFGRFTQDVSRQLLLGYTTQGVSTRYDGSYSVAYGESGMHFGQARGHVMPFVSVQYARIDRGAFAEQGAGGFGLRSDAQVLDRWQAGVGVRAGSRWEFGRGRAVDFGAHVQWQRTLASRGDVFNASFVGLEQWQPLAGIGLSRYGGVFGFDLDATLSQQTEFRFGYDYQMGERESAQALSARLNVAF